MRSVIGKLQLIVAVITLIVGTAQAVSPRDIDMVRMKESLRNAIDENNVAMYNRALILINDMIGFTSDEKIELVNNVIRQKAREGKTPPITYDFTNGIGAAIPDAASGLANIGTGAGQLYVANDQIKTIKAGTGITVTNNANDVTIATAVDTALITQNSNAIISLESTTDDIVVGFSDSPQVTTYVTTSISNIANVSMALVPKGSGALLVTIPDGTVTGGNARGNNAVDLQFDRILASNVASGENSTIAGGNSNTASGDFATTGGGLNNTASGNFSTIGGGYSSTASGDYSAVAGGRSNIVTAQHDVISGGQSNVTTGSWSTIGGGNNNSVNELYSTIAGGQSNISYGDWAFIGSGLSNITSGSYSVVGGGQSNDASGGWATICGGKDNTASGDFATTGGGLSSIASGNFSTIGGGFSSTASGDYSTIGGGNNNSINEPYATIAGGQSNISYGDWSFIGSGLSNITSGSYSVVGGGQSNDASGSWSTIGGGSTNIISNGFQSTIGGGGSNKIYSDGAVIVGGNSNKILGNRIFAGTYSIIGGGSFNAIKYVNYATISGGKSNTVSGTGAIIAGGGITDTGVSAGNTAIGAVSFIGGGRDNITSGSYSVALGRNADAAYDGSFVWGDSTSAIITSTLANAVYFQASGGMHIYTTADGSPTLGATLPQNNTAWAPISDRNMKENFQEVDSVEVLRKLIALPITQWNYKGQADTGIRNIGPMAQDFWEAFHLGHDDLHIDTLNADGVTMAALQGMYKLYEKSQQELQETKDVLAIALEQLQNVQQRLDALEQK